MIEEASMKNTKKEMLEIIRHLQKKLEEKEKAKLNPKNIVTIQVDAGNFPGHSL